MVQMFAQATVTAGVLATETGVGVVPGLTMLVGVTAINIVSVPQFS